MKPKHEISEVLNLYKEDFLQKYKASNHVLRTLNALQICRTAALGGHIFACKECGAEENRYNSCRNPVRTGPQVSASSKRKMGHGT